MQNIQRKLDRLTQRGALFKNHAIAGHRVKDWEDFFDNDRPIIPPLIAIRNSDHETVDDLVFESIRGLLGLLLQVPHAAVLPPIKELVEKIQKHTITPRLTALILKRISRLGGSGVFSPYLSMSSRTVIAEPYYLLLFDLAAEVMVSTPMLHPNSLLGKAVTAYAKSKPLANGVMQRMTNGQRLGRQTACAEIAM